jgi:WD40 repeat protein
MQPRNSNVLFRIPKAAASVSILIVALTSWAGSTVTDRAAMQITSKLLYELEDNMPVTSLAWSADGRFIASSSSQDNRIHIWDVAKRKIAHEFKSSTSAVEFHELSWSPDSKWLVACDGLNGRALLVNTVTWDLPQVLDNGRYGCQHSAFSSDGSQLAILAGTVTVYSTTDWKVLKTAIADPAAQWRRGAIINVIDYLAGTHTIVLGGYQFTQASPGHAQFAGYLWILGPEDALPPVRKQVYFPSAHLQTGIVTGLAVSSDGQQIATGTDTGTGAPGQTVSDSVHILRTSDWSIIGSPLDGKGYSQQSGLEYTPDGRFLIVGHGSVRVEHVVHIIDTKSYAVVGSVFAHGTIYDVAVEPSSTAFAVSAGGTISIWTLPPNR